MGIGISIALDGIPDDQLSNAATVEINERMGEATSFRLRYSVDISEGDLPWLIEEKLDPCSEFSIFVPLNNTAHCLVKGSVSGQQVHMVHGGGGSWMEVHGTDSSMQMDHATKVAVWTDASDSDAVSSVFSNYGFILDVETTNSRHLEDKHALVQRESDFKFVSFTLFTAVMVSSIKKIAPFFMRFHTIPFHLPIFILFYQKLS